MNINQMQMRSPNGLLCSVLALSSKVDFEFGKSTRRIEHWDETLQVRRGIQTASYCQLTCVMSAGLCLGVGVGGGVKWQPWNAVSRCTRVCSSALECQNDLKSTDPATIGGTSQSVGSFRLPCKAYSHRLHD